MFVFENLTNNQKGDLAEAAIRLAAIRLELGVYEPASGHSRADLLLEIEDKLWRVQVKWGSLSPDGSVIRADLRSSYLSPAGYVHTRYSEREVDLIAIYCGELDRSFLIPIQEVAGMAAFQLRVTPARNNQRLCINLAEQYEFPGAVAQLARASPWHGGGQGFESPQLHSSDRGDPAAVSIGSSALWDDLGGMMERVTAGQEIVMTRRGKPRFRMTPLD